MHDAAPVTAEPFGQWVIEEACRTLAWIDEPLAIAVNLSPRQLLQQDLPRIRLPGPLAPDRSVQCHTVLREAALRADAPAWRAAWQALDAQLPEPDTAELQLTLCSESAAQTWQARPQGWLARWRQAFSRPDTTAALRALIPA